MKVVYFSLTGQTRKFVNKLEMDSLELTPTDPFIPVNEPYIIITPTYDREMTEILNDFIETEHNQSFLKGVAGGGNLNFAQLFVFTAKDLAEEYNVPLIHCFEFQGNEEDVLKIKKVVDDLGYN
ncbi:class Ib ribonucleoside-diphosphate reductase assembly flavoprotein NrdI [Marinilactibacillus kalidii]|uniref:class Ib ribonucleoside-diphosphate reductase assembly flavoprotein NrdI n=1 Tax=Marinilactibacillus kalidii TaxID=2820274 RepID=UPI001ABE2498|nr:class Ib ribonucleoside-diphosphate reductase assembly flavoprotein NrdI [Marinilactibacillus kalidii]